MGVPAKQDAHRDSKHDDFAEQLLKQVFNNPNEVSGQEQRSQQKLYQWSSEEQEEIRMLLQETGRHKGKILIVQNKDWS
jgi:hypothetical protein